MISRLVPAGKETVRPACKKCGYAGHLTYQCRNFIKVMFCPLCSVCYILHIPLLLHCPLDSASFFDKSFYYIFFRLIPARKLSWMSVAPAVIATWTMRHL